MKQVYPALILAISVTALVLGCGGGEAQLTTVTPVTSSGTATPVPTAAVASPTEPAMPATAVPPTSTPAPLPQWKYVNSGWVAPKPEFQVGPLEEGFRVFVLTSQEDLDEFQESSRIKISRGTGTSLGNAEFEHSILVAAYLMWRPLQGDPLSVVGFNFETGQSGSGGRAEIQLDLEDSPQGRERPYLLAPMTMVALDRSIFPEGETVEFVFFLNRENMPTVFATVMVTPN